VWMSRMSSYHVVLPQGACLGGWGGVIWNWYSPQRSAWNSFLAFQMLVGRFMMCEFSAVASRAVSHRDFMQPHVSAFQFCCRSKRAMCNHVRSASLIGYGAAPRANHELSCPLLTRRCSWSHKKGGCTRDLLKRKFKKR